MTISQMLLRLVLALTSLAPALALAQTASAQSAQVQSAESAAPSAAIGTVTHLSGVLTVQRANGTTKLLAVKSEIREGDTLVTQSDTYARIKFEDDAEIVLRPQSRVLIANYVDSPDDPQGDKVVIRLIDGGLRSVTGRIGKRNHDAIQFQTPQGQIQVRGTHFGALFCQNNCGGVPTPNGSTPQNGLHVDVTQGAIVIANPGGSQVFQAGQFGYVANLNTPPMVIPPAQGIPVTMPPSISQNKSPASSAGGSKVNACVVQ